MTQIRTLLHFRPAGLEDLPHIERLRRERWVLLCQSDARYHQQQPGDLRAWMTTPDCQLWVGEKSSQGVVLSVSHPASTTIVGYLTAWQNTSPYGVLPPHITLIDELALDAHKYHAGLGRGLVEQVITQPHTQTTRIIACVPRYHAVEQAFWRALGAVAFEPPTEADFITTPPPTSLWMSL